MTLPFSLFLLTLKMLGIWTISALPRRVCSWGKVAEKCNFQENLRTLWNILIAVFILISSSKSGNYKKHDLTFLSDWIQAIFLNDVLGFQGCAIIEWAESSSIYNIIHDFIMVFTLWSWLCGNPYWILQTDWLFTEV